MTRGKHAARAAHRRDEAETTQLIETLQRKEADLTKALEEERTSRAKEVEAYRKEIRILRDAANSGTSPALAAAEEQIRVLVKEQHKSASKVRQLIVSYRDYLRRVTELAEALTGVSNHELRALLFGTEANYQIVDQKHRDLKMVEALYQARRANTAISRDASGYVVVTVDPDTRRLPFDILPPDHPFYDLNKALANEHDDLIKQIAQLHTDFVAAISKTDEPE